MFRAVVQRAQKLGVECLIFLIKIYQALISPWVGHCCRFQPTCSQYAKEVLQERGVCVGVYFTLSRLVRCHPFHPGGFDPPPVSKERFEKNGY